jgi:toxin HigB-1
MFFASSSCASPADLDGRDQARPDFGAHAASVDLYHGRRSSRALRFPADLRKAALRKLDMMEAALDLGDLRSPPGNRLEALRGDLAGEHSVRVNEQWRLVFRWTPSGAERVRLVDYRR